VTLLKVMQPLPPFDESVKHFLIRIQHVPHVVGLADDHYELDNHGAPLALMFLSLASPRLLTANPRLQRNRA
jgi:hypothetical protein